MDWFTEFFYCLPQCFVRKKKKSNTMTQNKKKTKPISFFHTIYIFKYLVPFKNLWRYFYVILGILKFPQNGYYCLLPQAMIVSSQSAEMSHRWLYRGKLPLPLARSWLCWVRTAHYISTMQKLYTLQQFFMPY